MGFLGGRCGFRGLRFGISLCGSRSLRVGLFRLCGLGDGMGIGRLRCWCCRELGLGFRVFAVGLRGVGAYLQ